MVVLTIALLAVIVLLAIDIRMRMNPNDIPKDSMIRPSDDGSFQGSVDGDTVYPQPLPDSLIEQGTDWTSDNVDAPDDASRA